MPTPTITPERTKPLKASWLCRLGFHKMMFVFREGEGERLVRVMCGRENCDYIADQFWADFIPEDNAPPTLTE